MAQERGLASGGEVPQTLQPTFRAIEALNIGLAVLALVFAAYFLLAWIFLPSWVHIELTVTAPGYVLKPGESFLSDLPAHVLNLRIAESGLYRPRLLSFLIEYADMNAARRIHDAFPQLGIKLPSYGLSIIATVAAFVWFWKTLFPRDGYGIALIAGTSLLYCDVYMNTSFMVLRGGKFLIPAAGIFCVTLFIRYQRRALSPTQLVSCIGVACLVFLLTTLDEQIAALVIFIAGVAFVVAAMQRRITQAAVIFALAAIAYPLYVMFWGRWLFGLFTPGGIEHEHHYHQFSDVFKVTSTHVSNAMRMLLTNVEALGVAGILLAAVLAVSMGRIIVRGNERFQKLFVVVAFTLFPLILTTFMTASHPDMFLIKELWTIFYLSLATHMLIAVVTWSSALAEFETGLVKIALAAAFLWICASGLYRMSYLYEASCVRTNRVINGEGPSQNLACGSDLPFRSMP